MQLQVMNALLLIELAHITVHASTQQYRELREEKHFESTSSVEITNFNNSSKLPKLRRQVESEDYFWAPIHNTIVGESREHLGASIALSGDGRKVAIAAPHTSDEDRSYVKVYELDVGRWRQSGNIIPVSERRNDFSLDLSTDGSRVVIGESWHMEVRIYEWNALKIWEQVGNYLSPRYGSGRFGVSVSISGNGTMVAIGADDDGFEDEGCSYVFYEESENWKQVGSKVCGGSENYLGAHISLSDDGLTLAVGSFVRGRTKVFELEQRPNGDSDWVQVGSDFYHDFVNQRSMSLSGDGTTLVRLGMGNDGNYFVRVHHRLYLDEGQRQVWRQWGSGFPMDNINGTVAISHDGKKIIVGDGYKNTAHVFQMTIDRQWIQMGDDLYPGEDFHLSQWHAPETSVSISGDGSTVAAGIRNAGIEFEDQGLVQVFGVVNGAPSMTPTMSPTPSSFHTSRISTPNKTAIILGSFGGLFILVGVVVSFQLWRKQKKRLEAEVTK